MYGFDTTPCTDHLCNPRLRLLFRQQTYQTDLLITVVFFYQAFPLESELPTRPECPQACSRPTIPYRINICYMCSLLHLAFKSTPQIMVHTVLHCTFGGDADENRELSFRAKHVKFKTYNCANVQTLTLMWHRQRRDIRGMEWRTFFFLVRTPTTTVWNASVHERWRFIEIMFWKFPGG